MKVNRKNLIKLRDGILGVPDEFVNMSRYRVGNDGSHEQQFYSDNECGSVGCILGWSPFIDGLETITNDFSRKVRNRKCLSFDDYSYRVFGISLDHPSSFDAWDWMFSPSWEREDNTSQGAAFRIQYLLDNRMKPPSGFGVQNVRAYRKELYSSYQEAHDGKKL